MNVYFVKGLKANLISVSQLCDEGFTVVFSATDCRAINAYGVTILQGIRLATTATCGKRRSSVCQLKGMLNCGTNGWAI